MKLVSIIDYGCGNIRSVFNALNAIREKKNIKVLVTNEEKEIKKSNYLRLPGVGSFESCIKGLIKSNLLDVISFKVKDNGIPFLGICVGMQMLSSKSYENGVFDGLGWIEGKVKKIEKIQKNLKIPHMGWNNLVILKETPFIKNLEKKINLKKVNAYFVHSYKVSDSNSENISSKFSEASLAKTEYGGEFISHVWNGENLFASQFHPEKSGELCLKFLENFVLLN